MAAVGEPALSLEAERVARLIVELSGRVARAGSDLVGQHLDHDFRLQPDVGHQDRIDARRLFGLLETAQPPVQLAPACV